jgi:hypothetical protein
MIPRLGLPDLCSDLTAWLSLKAMAKAWLLEAQALKNQSLGCIDGFQPA